MIKILGIKSLPGRFVRDKAGATVVEFALVAPLFFALTFSILEAGYYFFVNSAVEAATAKASRLIRTGQAQSGGYDKDTFFTEICNVVKHLGDCDEKLTVEVTSFATFDALATAGNTAPTCRNAPPADVGAIAYSMGSQRQIVRVRVCFLYDGVNPGVGMNLERGGDGSHEMISTTIFRNEPYGS